MSFRSTQGAIRYSLVIDDINVTSKLNNFENGLKLKKLLEISQAGVLQG